MRLKSFQIFESIDIRLDSLKQAFFNIEDLVGIEEVSYTRNNKDYYTILITYDYDNEKENFSSAADQYALKAEVYKLLNRNFKKIEEQVDFSYGRDLTERGRNTELKIHFISDDKVDITEVILIDGYDYHCDTVKLKTFFKQRYDIDVISSNAFEDYTKHGDPYSVIKIDIKQTEDEAGKYHNKIVEDFDKLKIEGEFWDFVEEMSISSNSNGDTVIAIYVTNNLSIN